jgi:site-specific recombinase XerD
VYHLRRWLADEKARGISDRTLEGDRQVFSSYFGWLHREGLIASNPVGNLGAIKYQKKEKDIFSDTDIERMKFGAACVRDRAIVHFLRATGCRISEMTQLNRDDVDFANLECRVLGKGNKERTVYLDAVAAMVLQSYLKSRTDACPALFIGKGSDRLTPGGVRFMLSKLGQSSQVQHVHPHKFRRTTATNLIRHGMPIQEVAAILGHDKLDTTMQYVVLDKSIIKSSYQKYA